MKTKELKEIIDLLLASIEEEDIGISLYSTHYQEQRELDFFSSADRERVVSILKKLSEDSRRHKAMLEKIISLLGARCHGK